MKLRVFVVGQATGQPVPRALVRLVAVANGKYRIDIASTFTDQQGYGRLTSIDSERLRAALLTFEEQGDSLSAIEVLLEAAGRPESAVTLWRLADDGQDGLGAAASFDVQIAGAAAVAGQGSTPHVLVVEGDPVRGPLGKISDPDTTDYALSPRSFLLESDIKVGDGNCEHLAPAVLPLREYSIYQVAVISPKKEGEEDEAAEGIPSVKDPIQPDNKVRWGQVLEFRQTWRSLGHSLGEIKYSLTLAPGEAVKIAVIDWKREDTASRTATNASKDRLAHQQTADREIDDVVTGRVNEEQQGSSVMAGLAGAADFTIPQYGISAAGRHSIGAGFAYTRGTRDVAGAAQQDIHSQVLQRTNLVRSQSSTVVVQATQQESSYLATRIVANMNRGHALSVLYYEIIRHLRVRTEFVRADPCVLIPVAPISFDRAIASRYRAQIEPSLLDSRHSGGFDAIERIAAGMAAAGADAGTGSTSGGTPAVTPQKSPVAIEFEVALTTEWRWNYIESKYKGPADTAGSFSVEAVLRNGDSVVLVSQSERPPVFEQFKNISEFPAFFPGWGVQFEEKDTRSGLWGRAIATFTATGKMLDLRSLERVVVKWRRVRVPVADVLDGWNLTGLKVVAKTVDSTYALVDHRYALTGGKRELFPPSNTNDFITNTEAPLLAVDLSSPPPIPSTNSTATISTSTGSAAAPTDEKLATALVNHLNDNSFYYGARVWLAMDPRERRLRLAPHAGELLSQVSDQPLAMSGNHLAFRYNGALPPEIQEHTELGDMSAIESVTTLPTRGVFAEAHLGHCNGAEERDITRYWGFDELPVSLLPNIETLSAAPRGQIPGLSPDTMGASPLSVQPYPGMPAPGEAVAKAFELLAKPDIFRDMSARQEVAEVMGKLIESAKPPALTGENVGSAFNKTPAKADTGTKTPDKSETPSTTPTGQSFLDPDRYAGTFIDPKGLFDESKAIGSMLDKSGIEPSEKKEIIKSVARRPTAPKTPAVPERVIQVFVLQESGSMILPGTYQFRVEDVYTGAGVEFAFEVDANRRSGQVRLPLPPGTLRISGAIRPRLPDSVLRIPVRVLPLMDPITFNAERSRLNPDREYTVIHQVSIDDKDKVITLNLRPKTRALPPVEREIQLSANATSTAQWNSEVKLGIEAKGDIEVAEIGGTTETAIGAAYSLSGTLGASQTLKLTMIYRVLEAYELTRG